MQLIRTAAAKKDNTPKLSRVLHRAGVDIQVVRLYGQRLSLSLC